MNIRLSNDSISGFDFKINTMATLLKHNKRIQGFVLCCFFFLGLFTSSCKKGDNDPFLSLRTRKARLTGDWHLESGKLTLTFKKDGRSDNSLIYTYTEDSYAFINTANGSTREGRYKFQITFTKDGDFTFLQLIGSSNINGNGTWDFLKGIGTYKNKERVSFKSNAIGGGSYWIDTFNKSENYFIYDISELRDKKLVLETNNELVSVSDKDSSSFYVTCKYTFVQ